MRRKINLPREVLWEILSVVAHSLNNRTGNKGEKEERLKKASEANTNQNEFSIQFLKILL